MKKAGYIALYRKFLDWEWFTDIKTCHLFLYCLLRANYKNTEWHGIKLKKGQFVTSLRTLSFDTGLSLQNVRTSLKKLTQELTHESHNCYSIITVKNYSQYQETNTQTNNQLTTDNNIINRISNKNINISLSNISKEEREILKNYILRQKRKPDNLDAYIKTLIDNGDWVQIVEKEKKRLERLKAKEEIAAAEKKAEEERKKDVLSAEELARLARQYREKLRVINGGG